MCVSEFVDSVNAIYVRKNLFKLPTGKAGKEFIKELTHWLEIFNSKHQLKFIAIKVFMILPANFAAETIKETARQNIIS